MESQGFVTVSGLTASALVEGASSLRLRPVGRVNGVRPATVFSVMTAAAAMPRSCWGTYRRVAVVEHLPGVVPAMISERARGVVRVVETWEKCNVGKTERSAYAVALREAEALRDQLVRRASR